MKRFGQNKKVRLQTLRLTSQLSRWCQIREDLYYAFGKCLESGMESPLRETVQAFITRVKGGMSTGEALDIMQNQINEEHFNDLITAIRFNLRYRGDLPELLEHMEARMFKVEEEYTRRRISTAHERNMAIMMICASPAIWIIRLLTDAQTRSLFLETDPGRMLLIFSMVLAAIAAAAFFIVLKRINS